MSQLRQRDSVVVMGLLIPIFVIVVMALPSLTKHRYHHDKPHKRPPLCVEYRYPSLGIVNIVCDDGNTYSFDLPKDSQRGYKGDPWRLGWHVR